MKGVRLTILEPAILNGEAGAVLERAIADAPVPVEVVAFIVPAGRTGDLAPGVLMGTDDVYREWRDR